MNNYIKYIYLFIIISFATNILYISPYELALAKKIEDEDDDKKDKKEKDKLVVKARIDLKNINIENTKFLRVTAFINGEDFKKDILISSIDKNKNKLDVELKTDKENDIVEADIPDEFFVCAYQIGKKILTEYNSFTKFDCNEGDILSTSKPNVINLFKSDSHVYEKSQAVYQANLNADSNNNSDKVKIKILAPLSDKKDTEKLIISAMVKGQIQSEVIENVQAELDKSDSDTIKRTFTFDRKTDIGLIQIGDRYHACVSSEDLRPPEGTECEKRLIKHLDTPNSLPAR
jgi:hypothetical protein